MNTLHSIANFVCDIVVTNSSVCDYTMKVMAEVVVPILKNSLFSSDYLCAQVLKVCDRPHYKDYTTTEYITKLLTEKPPDIRSNDFLNKLYASIIHDSDRRVIKAVQMSDPHVDFYYTPGTIADCNMPICCRPENGFTSDPKRAAGQWGNYNCDLPH